MVLRLLSILLICVLVIADCCSVAALNTLKDSVSTASALSVQGVSDTATWNKNIKSWMDGLVTNTVSPLRRLRKRDSNETEDSLVHQYYEFGSNLFGVHLKLSPNVIASNDSTLLAASRTALQALVQKMQLASSSNTNKSEVNAEMDKYIDRVEQDHKVYVSSPYFRGNPEQRRLSRRGNVSSSSYLTPSDVINFTDTTVSNPPGWALARISQKSLPIGNRFIYPNTSGVDVTAYVIDTGVQIANSEFEGRATLGTSTYSESASTDDENGHGTFVAALIAGRYVGVARSTKIIAVKTLGADGSGSASEVLSGLTWAVNDWTSKGKHKVIINMSLGTSYSSAINSAVAAAVKQGVPITVAAGNDGDNACDYSPSSESTVITVGASDQSDTIADFSNYGSCVNLIGPGDDVYSLALDSSGTASGSAAASSGSTYSIESGTSFASPYVAGVASLILSTLVSSSAPPPSFVKNCLTGLAIGNQISGLGGSKSSTPNLLTYTGFTATGVVNQNDASSIYSHFLANSVVLVLIALTVFTNF